MRFQESSPNRVTKDVLIPPAMSCDNTCKMVSGKLIRDSLPRIFIRDYSKRHSLLSMYQNSRLAEGKQVFSKNHNVCTKSLSTVSCSYKRMVGMLLKPSNPGANQWPALQAGLSKNRDFRTAMSFYAVF